MKKLVLSAFLFSFAFIGCESDDKIYTGPDFAQFDKANIPDVEVREDARQLKLRVILSNPSSSDLTVNFQYTDGTAINGVHYTGVNSIVIPAGETRATVLIPIIDDRDSSETRDFKVTIAGTSDSNYVASISEAFGQTKNVTILNIDCDTTTSYAYWAEESLSLYDVGDSTTNGIGEQTAECDVLKLTGDIGTGLNIAHLLTFTAGSTPDAGTVNLPLTLSTDSPGTVSGQAVYKAVRGTGTYNVATGKIVLDYTYLLATTTGQTFQINGYYSTGTNEITVNPEN
nr:Calx-beta domain-containing protein [uncultured Flavobacterium sp.]